jgi:hypothetical protein
VDVTGDDDEKHWPGRDFHDLIELCRCCAAELVASGLRWSPFLCRECQRLAQKFNSSLGVCAVPIGANSVMNGVSLSLGQAVDHLRAAAFIERCEGLFAGMDRLREWRRLAVRETLQFGWRHGVKELPVSEYLHIATPVRLAKHNRWSALVKWLTGMEAAPEAP